MRVTQAPLLIFSRPEIFLRRVAIRRRYAFLFSEIDPTRGFRCFLGHRSKSNRPVGFVEGTNSSMRCLKKHRNPLVGSISENKKSYLLRIATRRRKIPGREKIKSGACVTRISTLLIYANRLVAAHFFIARFWGGCDDPPPHFAGIYGMYGARNDLL